MEQDDSKNISELSYEDLSRVYAQALTRIVVMEGGSINIPMLPPATGDLPWRLHHKVHPDGSIDLVAIPAQKLN